jgi:hypothetical protein
LSLVQSLRREPQILLRFAVISCWIALTVMALAPPRTMIVAIAMTVPLTPTLSRKRARGTRCRYATFTLSSTS